MNPDEEKPRQGIAKRRLRASAGGMYFTPKGVSVASLASAEEVQDWAGRRKTAPVRKWFVRSLDGEAPMLSTLYSGEGKGGRSGYVTIKVLLCLLWKTSKPPFTTIMTAPALAELLDLPDPRGKGARRVRDALQALAAANLVRLTPRPGNSPLIQLMNETGNGEEYSLPSTAFVRSQLARSTQPIMDPSLYFQLPEELWTEGFFQALKGPGLVMLLILLAEEGHKKPVWFSGAEFNDRYRISPSTRTKGTQELVELDILDVDSVRLPADWGSSTFERQRRRYQYQLTGVISRLIEAEVEPRAAISEKPKTSTKKTATEPIPPQASVRDKAKKRKRRQPTK